MYSPTLLSKIHELTNNSSVETFDAAMQAAASVASALEIYEEVQIVSVSLDT